MTTTADIVQQAAALATQAAHGVDIWESVVALGLNVTTYKAVCNYILGQAAAAVTIRHGEGSLSAWCEQVNIDSVDTAQQYRRIVECIGFERCITAAANNVKYTFVRRIVGAFKDHDDSAARDYLDIILTLPIGAEYPKLPDSGEGMVTVFKANDIRLCGVNEQSGMFTLHSPVGLGKLMDIAPDEELDVIVRKRKKPIVIEENES